MASEQGLSYWKPRLLFHGVLNTFRRKISWRFITEICQPASHYLIHDLLILLVIWGLVFRRGQASPVVIARKSVSTERLPHILNGCRRRCRHNRLLPTKEANISIIIMCRSRQRIILPLRILLLAMVSHFGIGTSVDCKIQPRVLVV